MKKVLALILSLAVATPAFAGPRHYNPYRVDHHHHHRSRISTGDAIVIGIGGIILGAAINESNKSKEQVVKQVIVQPTPVTVTKVVVCTEWKEIMTSDGQVYKERTCTEQ
jgi:hypothetical protein